MNVETVREYCLSKRGVTESFPFDDVSLVIKVMNKYWNSVRFDSDVDDKLMKELIDHSYDEVIKKFTKKLRAEYDALP